MYKHLNYNKKTTVKHLLFLRRVFRHSLLFFTSLCATNQSFYILLHYKQVSLSKRFVFKNIPNGERLSSTNTLPK